MARNPAQKTDSGPGRDDVLRYLREQDEPVVMSELARAFDAKGKARTALRRLLRELEDEGLIESPQRRRYASRDRLPSVAVLEVTGPDADGELRARPLRWPDRAPPPEIFVAPLVGPGRALAAGERILARIRRNEDGTFEARPMRRLGTAPREVVGVFERVSGRGRIRPTDKRAKSDYDVARNRAGGARDGDLVRARVLSERAHGLRQAEVVERIGHIDSPGAIGVIALHANDIPIAFPDAALEEAEAVRPPTPEGRVDLRGVPLVTIDGEDARDFDDAVFAEPDPAPGNPDGWHLIVAIADVSWFVRPGSALDEAAYQRGNSVYLPDRVVPMLPMPLSADLCSLRPHEDRAVLAAHLRIDSEGRLRDHRFERAMMRSAARLTYRQVQAARDRNGEGLPADLPPRIVANLYDAHRALLADRRRRGTLELELPEYAVAIGEDGAIAEISRRETLSSHRLIEDFMIAANVAAAETLEAQRVPCMYRVHEPPDPAKLEALRQFLETFGLTLPRGQVIRARQFANILSRAARDPSAEVIHEAILRSQSQAVYSPANLGHFGLALRRYAHFTSPIRRYSDLLVHRGLVSALRLGAGGLPPDSADRFEAIGEHISDTERRAQAAEREATDRYMALYLEDRVGARMPGRIVGVTRFGLFVRLSGLGAEGLVPVRTIGDERFRHDEHRHTLEGQASGLLYTMGDEVEVEVREANAATGSLIFGLTGHTPSAAPQPARGGSSRGPRGKPERPGRPPKKRSGKGKAKARSRPRPRDSARPGGRRRAKGRGRRS